MKSGKTPVMHLSKFLPLALGMTLFPVATAAQPPSFSWSWQQSSISNSQCVRRASTVLSQAGFRNIDTVGDNVDTSVYAANGNYTGIIRCITRQRMIVFLVAGPDTSRASGLESRLSDSF
jgi:hypothetical protein